MVFKRFVNAYFVIAMLFSMNAWPFWNIIDPRYVWGFFALGFVLFLLFYPKPQNNDRKSWFFAIYLLLIVLYTTQGNFWGFVGAICPVLPVIVYLLDSQEDKIIIYGKMYNSLVWITGVSLAAWLLYTVGLPSYWYPETLNDYIFENHLLFVVDLRHLISFSRFSGIFVEPGYYGCLIAIVLFIEEFNFKKFSNIVLLSALFFTFSLGGWVIAGVGFLLRTANKRELSKIVSSLLVFSALIAFGVYYKGGNNIIYKRVLYRLEYDKSRETFVGDNRSKDSFNEWFEDYFITSHEAFLGSQKTYDDVHTGSSGTEANVGWRLFIVHYGFLGLVLYLLFMFLLCRYYPPSFMSYGLFLLEILFFWQIEHQFKTAYLLVFYLAGVSLLSSSKSKRSSYIEQKGVQTLSS